MPDNKYAERLAEQKRQYRSGDDIHDLPAIFYCWSHKYLRHKLVEVFGCSRISDVYANAFADVQKSASDVARLISIGSGSSDVEIELCTILSSRGISNFSLLCLEVSPQLIEEAHEKIRQNELDDYIDIRHVDINHDVIDFRCQV
jgi:hypothetical protein